MKQIFAFFLFLMIAFFSNSCADKCKNVNCNEGICVEGICNCYPGYSGEFCDFKLTGNFKGNWSGNFSCSGLSQAASINIIDFDSDIKRLQLNTVGVGIQFGTLDINLDDKPLTAYCNDDYKGFDIPSQNIVLPPFAPGLPGISATITGNGILISPGTLNMTIKIENTDFVITFDCTGIFNQD